MPINKAQKTELIQKLASEIKAAKSVVFTQFHGLSVKDNNTLRDQMAEQGVKYKVAKKTLIKLAAKEAGYGDIPDDAISGPVAVAFSMETEVAAAKLIFDFSKKNENIKLLGGLFEGKVLSVKEAKVLAQLPTKEELLSKLVYVLNSPIQGFHGVLNNTIGGFVRVLNAIKEKQAA